VADVTCIGMIYSSSGDNNLITDHDWKCTYADHWKLPLRQVIVRLNWFVILCTVVTTPSCVSQFDLVLRDWLTKNVLRYVKGKLNRA